MVSGGKEMLEVRWSRLIAIVGFYFVLLVLTSFSSRGTT